MNTTDNRIIIINIFLFIISAKHNSLAAKNCQPLAFLTYKYVIMIKLIVGLSSLSINNTGDYYLNFIIIILNKHNYFPPNLN